MTLLILSNVITPYTTCHKPKPDMTVHLSYTREDDGSILTKPSSMLLILLCFFFGWRKYSQLWPEQKPLPPAPAPAIIAKQDASTQTNIELESPPKKKKCLFEWGYFPPRSNEPIPDPGPRETNFTFFFPPSNPRRPQPTPRRQPNRAPVPRRLMLELLNSSSSSSSEGSNDSDSDDGEMIDLNIPLPRSNFYDRPPRKRPKNHDNYDADDEYSDSDDEYIPIPPFPSPASSHRSFSISTLSSSESEHEEFESLSEHNGESGSPHITPHESESEEESSDHESGGESSSHPSTSPVPEEEYYSYPESDASNDAVEIILPRLNRLDTKRDGWIEIHRALEKSNSRLRTKWKNYGKTAGNYGDYGMVLKDSDCHTGGFGWEPPGLHDNQAQLRSIDPKLIKATNRYNKNLRRLIQLDRIHAKKPGKRHPIRPDEYEHDTESYKAPQQLRRDSPFATREELRASDNFQWHVDQYRNLLNERDKAFLIRRTPKNAEIIQEYAPRQRNLERLIVSRQY